MVIRLADWINDAANDDSGDTHFLINDVSNLTFLAHDSGADANCGAICVLPLWITP